jgi:uncharacterized membrane protein
MARGINNRGDIVGAYCIEPPRHALLIKAGQFIPLAPTTILGTNFSGFGDLLDADGNLLEEHGFMWKNGAFTEVNFPGSVDSAVLGINARGDLVGTWDTGLTSPGHGFEWAMLQF